MAETTSVATTATLPSSDDLARASKFTREPLLPEGEDAASLLAPGTPHRRAFDAALAEIDAGLTAPSVTWRRNFSLLLGLERLLSQDEPALVDGTVLSAHQVDALSGTLTALYAEGQRNGNGNGAADRGARARPGGHPRRGGPRRRRRARGAEGLGRDAGRGRRGAARRGAGGPQRGQALLVRARHRRRQDGRRARLRRGLADRRRPHPDPPPQPRRPVPRRAARPRLRGAHRPGAAEGPGPRGRAGDGRDLPVVRAQRREDLRRLHDRHLRRGAHRAGREDLRLDPSVGRPDLHRHDGHGRR